MKKIIIVGTGGFAAEVVQYIHDNQEHQNSFNYQIKGFLDINSEKHRHYNFKYPLLGDEDTYQVNEEDVFIIAIAEVLLMKTKEKIVQKLLNKNAKFINMIHYTANIAKSAQLGEGNILAPFTILGPKAKIGNYNSINYYSSIAHDSSLGDFNVLSPSTTVTGFVNIGNGNFFGTSARVLPNCQIGDMNKIQSGIVVDKEINNASLVYTNVKIGRMVIGND